MHDQRNLILAIGLSIAILLGFQYFIELPRLEQTRQQKVTASPPLPASAPAAPGAPAAQPGAPGIPGTSPASSAAAASREDLLGQGQRLRIEGKRITGSMSLKGGRLDDLSLTDYRVAIKPGSARIVLLSPVGAANPYYSESGWVAAQGSGTRVPDAETLWQADANALTADRPVTLTWDNGAGLRFIRRLAIDNDFMLTITQRVENSTDQAVSLHPYSLISRHGTPYTEGFYILHEGPLGVFREKAADGGTLKEISYSDILSERASEQTSVGGWIGFTDKYWLTALMPAQDQPIKAAFRASNGGTPRYQVDFLGGIIEIPAKGSAEASARLFAGAKETRLIDFYQDTMGIPRFDRAIDWGWFYWLTRPIFKVLDYFNHLIGNFGLAILLLTVIIKFLFLPLAYKSYVAMNQMKELQPEMMRLRQLYGDDKQRINQEMMTLYKREKVNPAAGCVPVLLQIPVFFALYKVLFITIEMRHAPFYGWIQDLSAPDPTTWVNLFGLLPFVRPDLGPLEIINIGIWPILMGISMWLQMRLNPQPPDPIQAKMFMLMPIIFTFMLASFPVGLVIYWTWNNLLSIGQQWFITKKTKRPKRA